MYCIYTIRNENEQSDPEMNILPYTAVRMKCVTFSRVAEMYEEMYLYTIVWFMLQAKIFLTFKYIFTSESHFDGGGGVTLIFYEILFRDSN